MRKNNTDQSKQPRQRNASGSHFSLCLWCLLCLIRCLTKFVRRARRNCGLRAPPDPKFARALGTEPDLAHATHALPSLPACNSPVPGLHHSRNVRKSHGAPLLSRFHFRFSICQLHQRSAHVPTDQTTPVGSAVPMPPRDHAFLGACGHSSLPLCSKVSISKKRLYSRMALGAEDGRHMRPRSPI